MSTVLFRRPARRNGPEMPTGDLNLQEPPELPEVQRGQMRQGMMMLPMVLMSGVMMLTFLGPSRGGMQTGVMAGLIGASMGGMALMTIGAAGAIASTAWAVTAGTTCGTSRRTGAGSGRVVGQQRDAAGWRHPGPGSSLWSLALTTRRWERRPTHPDFLEVRVGTGEQRLAVRIAPMQTKPVEDLEPLSAKSLRRFIRAYSTLADQPVALFLRGFAQIRLTGDRMDVRAVLRSLLLQVTTFHAPEEVRLALCLDDDAVNAWDWTKWLPHVQHVGQQDAAGARRVVADTVEGVEQLLGETFVARPRYESGTAPTRDEPFVILIRDGGRMGNGARLATAGYRNAVLIDLDEPAPAASKAVLCLHIDGDDLTMVRRTHVGAESRTRLARPDRVGQAVARVTAQALSPFRLGLATDAAEDTLQTDFDLSRLLGVPDLYALDLDRLWAPRPMADRLRVPIGVDAAGNPVGAGHQGVGAGRHGPARHADRRHRLGQERAAAHPGPRAGHHALLRDAELRSGGLQGRRHIPRP